MVSCNTECSRVQQWFPSAILYGLIQLVVKAVCMLSTASHAICQHGAVNSDDLHICCENCLSKVSYSNGVSEDGVQFHLGPKNMTDWLCEKQQICYQQLTVHSIKSGTRDKSGPGCSTHCRAIMLHNVHTVFGSIMNKLNFVWKKVQVFVQYLVHCSIRNTKCYYMISSSKLLHQT
jgi:hypothetical protein